MAARKTFDLPVLGPAQCWILDRLRERPHTAAELAELSGRAVRDIRASLQKLADRGEVQHASWAPRISGSTCGPIPQFWAVRSHVTVKRIA